MLIHGVTVTAELNWDRSLPRCRGISGSSPWICAVMATESGRVAVPARGLRGRRHRAGRGPGYRQLRRGGLLHGRHGRPAGLAAALRGGIRPGAVRHGAQRPRVTGREAGRPDAAVGGCRHPVESPAAARITEPQVFAPDTAPGMLVRYARLSRPAAISGIARTQPVRLPG